MLLSRRRRDVRNLRRALRVWLMHKFIGSVENLDQSQKSEGAGGDTGNRRHVLRQTSIVAFYARQTRSSDCCIDWACKIHECPGSRMPGIAQRWRKRNFRGLRHIGRTNLREQVFASALPESSQAPRLSLWL